jgi:5'-nucleotidase
MNDHRLSTLVIAVASRALFDLDESHRIFEQHGEDSYATYQTDNENVPLQPGVAFPLIKKLLALNAQLVGYRVEVILLSRNSPDTGLRIMNSIRHHGLDIRRAAFTRGRSPYRYAHAFGAQLFLSANPDDVRLALEAGMAAATILPSASRQAATGEVCIAFDGDAVVFSDESERVFAQAGLAAFTANEVRQREVPLSGGPFKPFLAALHALQSSHCAGEPLIRTALITARSAPAHERVIRTLRSWNIRIDEALFLGGLDKGIFLDGFSADIFFDDQRKNCEAAASYVAAGHVPYGVKNTAPGTNTPQLPLAAIAANA